jgi:uncharacterized membrane protein YqhA
LIASIIVSILGVFFLINFLHWCKISKYRSVLISSIICCRLLHFYIWLWSSFSLSHIRHFKLE